MIVLIISHFLTSAKFRRKGQIPRLGSEFCGPRKTVGPTYQHLYISYTTVALDLDHVH